VQFHEEANAEPRDTTILYTSRTQNVLVGLKVWVGCGGVGGGSAGCVVGLSAPRIPPWRQSQRLGEPKVELKVFPSKSAEKTNPSTQARNNNKKKSKCTKWFCSRHRVFCLLPRSVKVCQIPVTTPIQTPDDLPISGMSERCPGKS